MLAARLGHHLRARNDPSTVSVFYWALNSQAHAKSSPSG
jgi:hypothetical protein